VRVLEKMLIVNSRGRTCPYRRTTGLPLPPADAAVVDAVDAVVAVFTTSRLTVRA